MKQFNLKTVLFSLASLAITSFTFGANYSTLEDGNWDDNKSVWSLDGENPCHCSPGRDIDEKVIVSHNIQTSFDLNIDDEGLLKISKSANLFGAYSINMEKGSLIVEGRANISNLKQGKFSTLLLNEGQLNIFHQLDLNGQVELKDSEILLESGRIDLAEGIAMNLYGSSMIAVEFGEIYEDGKLVPESVISSQQNTLITNQESKVLIKSPHSEDDRTALAK